jgi:large subunit ribosomal protein L11
MSLVRKVRLLVPAGNAKPGPAIGQALGPLGINMMDFCKAFNARTQNIQPSTPCPVVLSAFANRTFEFVVKTPPTSWFLRRCASVEKGAKQPGMEFVGAVGTRALYEIAKIKHADIEQHDPLVPLEGVYRSVLGTAHSMGIRIRNEGGVKNMEHESR